jgi:hypothetical protein
MSVLTKFMEGKPWRLFLAAFLPVPRPSFEPGISWSQAIIVKLCHIHRVLHNDRQTFDNTPLLLSKDSKLGNGRYTQQRNGVLYAIRAIAACYNNNERCFLCGPCWGPTRRNQQQFSLVQEFSLRDGVSEFLWPRHGIVYSPFVGNKFNAFAYFSQSVI